MKRLFLVVSALIVGLLIALPAGADHGSSVHWAGTGDRNIRIVDSVTSGWDAAFTSAVTGWNTSPVINFVPETGSSSKRTRSKCRAPAGAIRVCNYNYGRTGWAGLAKFWYDGNDHVTQAWAKLNTKYVRTAADMQTVACHEIGHTLGLLHTAFASSCLRPVIGTGSTVPGPHDLDALALMYGHAGKTSTQLSGEEVSYGHDGAQRTVTIKILPTS